MIADWLLRYFGPQLGFEGNGGSFLNSFLIIFKNIQRVDVCCIQETKILAGCDENINNHRLICSSTDNKAYGLGFMVHDRWKNNIAKVWKVNERISVIQFKINSKKDHIITVINVYGPHTGITKTNPQEAEKFYDKLNEIIKEQRKTTSLLVIAGDFNSVVGKRTDDDNCLGKHSSGVRNRNGQNMINFCEFNSLLVTNTCFQHSQKHKTTWEQIRVSKGKNQVNKIRKTLKKFTCKVNNDTVVSRMRSEREIQRF